MKIMFRQYRNGEKEMQKFCLTKAGRMLHKHNDIHTDFIPCVAILCTNYYSIEWICNLLDNG